MAKSQKICSEVSEILKDFLAEHGLELYHIDFRREGKDWYLEIFIDKIQNSPDGEELYVSSDDCETVSRWLSDQLDEKDLIQQNYYLMVSSPGMDRELHSQEHFDRYVGKLVDIKLYEKIDGKKEYEGVLLGRKDGNILIRTEDGEERTFRAEKVVKTTLAVVF